MLTMRPADAPTPEAPRSPERGKTRAVLARHACNRRLCDACRSWAFTATQHSAPAKAYYGRRRAAGDGHETALRRVANKLLGQLHHCLAHCVPYNEQAAKHRGRSRQRPAQSGHNGGDTHPPCLTARRGVLGEVDGTPPLPPLFDGRGV